MEQQAKYVTIRVKETKLNKNGNGRILLYDDKNDWYYMTTLSDIVGVYDKRMEKMESDVAKAKEDFDRLMAQEKLEFERFMLLLKNENQTFKNETDHSVAVFKNSVALQYNSLLDTVKEVNERILQMVETSQEEE